MFVRHVQTGEILKLSDKEQGTYDPNYWVQVEGDVKPTGPEVQTTPTDADPDSAPKTTSKATPPK